MTRIPESSSREICGSNINDRPNKPVDDVNNIKNRRAVADAKYNLDKQLDATGYKKQGRQDGISQGQCRHLALDITLN